MTTVNKQTAHVDINKQYTYKPMLVTLLSGDTSNFTTGNNAIVVFTSRTLKEAELDYRTTRRELLSIVRCLKNLEHNCWETDLPLSRTIKL